MQTGTAQEPKTAPIVEQQPHEAAGLSPVEYLMRNVRRKGTSSRGPSPWFVNWSGNLGGE